MEFKYLNLGFWRYSLFYLKIEKLLDKQNYDTAITMLEQRLNDKLYSTVDIYYLLGKAHYEKGNYDKAIKSLEAYLKYNKDNDVYKANTLFYLGLAFTEQNDYQKTINVLNEAIEIKKNLKQKTQRDVVISLPNIYCCLGRAYSKLDDKQKAFTVFNEGLKYEPNNEALQRELTLLGAG